MDLFLLCGRLAYMLTCDRTATIPDSEVQHCTGVMVISDLT